MLTMFFFSLIILNMLELYLAFPSLREWTFTRIKKKEEKIPRQVGFVVMYLVEINSRGTDRFPGEIRYAIYTFNKVTPIG